MHLNLQLPWPPTANKYWRYWNGRVLISREAKEYKKDIKQLSYTWVPRRLYGKLSIDINVNPPDKRKRDLDNLLKITLDSLEATGLFDDDSQFDEIVIKRGEIIKDGQMIIKMYELEKET